ncbi:uncharacterized protein LOC143560046 [Bidens hawaiensis]|uniref:uncharacterized protein LOC143560046 n=1 Tax=Bidens hawaiensis TaxID=980011 RepID=UPI00404B3249
MKFPEKWRKWVSGILLGGRASVLVNRSPTPEFNCYRGLRQGDPLPPFLFVLAMKSLTGVMKKASQVGLFKGLRCGIGGPTMTHLLCADDVIFVGERNQENVLNLRRILRCFYLVSRLKINVNKSWVYGIRVEESERMEMASLLNSKTGTFPFKYLGLLVGGNMNLVASWDPVVETFRRRLSLWKAKKLSFGRRITVIKSGGAGSVNLGLNQGNNFSVRSLKRGIDLVQGGDVDYTIEWNNYVPKKVGVLAWRAEMERIPVLVELACRNVVVASTWCPVCDEAEEMAEHIFISCRFAQAVWHCIANWCKVPPFFAFSIHDILELHKHYRLPKRKAKLFHAVCLTLVWCLWKMRNMVVFERKEASVNNILCEIKALSVLWICNRSNKLDITWER